MSNEILGQYGAYLPTQQQSLLKNYTGPIGLDSPDLAAALPSYTGPAPVTTAAEYETAEIAPSQRESLSTIDRLVQIVSALINTVQMLVATIVGQNGSFSSTGAKAPSTTTSSSGAAENTEIDESSQASSANTSAGVTDDDDTKTSSTTSKTRTKTWFDKLSDMIQNFKTLAKTGKSIWNTAQDLGADLVGQGSSVFKKVKTWIKSIF